MIFARLENILQRTQLSFSVGLVIFFLILCIIIYWNGLQGPLVFDDFNNLNPLFKIEANPSVVLLNIQRYLLEMNRPVAFSTFIINAIVNGENIFYWKLTSLILHIFNGLLLFVFCNLLLSNRKYNYLLSALIAGIWLLHPLQVSTVLYIVQRMTILSAFFVLSALVLYVYGRRNQQSGGNGYTHIFISFLVLMPLGALSKENALLFPIFTLLLEAFIFHFKSGRGGENDKALIWFYLSFFIIGLVVFFIKFNSIVLSGYEIRDFTLYERLLTQSRVIVRYLFLLLVPMQQLMGFMHDDLQISTTIFQPLTTFSSIIFIFILIFFSCFARRVDKMLSFGVLFFFAGHLMESTIVPLELMFEHRNYLPSAGMIIAIVLALSSFQSIKSITLLLCISLILAVLTFNMTMRWSTWPMLFEYMYSVHPESKRLRSFMAKYLTEQEMYHEAETMLMTIGDLRADIQRLEVMCIADGELESDSIIRVADKINRPIISDSIIALGNLSNAGLKGRCEYDNQAFIQLIDRALAQRIQNDFEEHKLLVYKGYHLWDDGRHTEALKAFELAHQRYHNDPIPLLMAINLSYKTDDIDRALDYLKQVRNIPEPYTINFNQDIVGFEKLLIKENNSGDY